MEPGRCGLWVESSWLQPGWLAPSKSHSPCEDPRVFSRPHLGANSLLGEEHYIPRQQVVELSGTATLEVMGWKDSSDFLVVQ